MHMMISSSSETITANIDDLCLEAQRLWHDDPAVDAIERQALLLELADIDLSLERLSLERIALRAAGSELDSTHHAKVHECADRLHALRRHWRTDA